MSTDLSNEQIDKAILEAAVAELRLNHEEYKELLDVLRDPKKRKNIPLILKEGMDVYREFGRDQAVAGPAVKQVVAAMKSGTSTSEYEKGSAVDKLLTVVGVGAPLLEVLLNTLEQASFGGNSIWVTTAAMVLKALISVAYTSGRSKVKAAALSGQPPKT